MASTGNKTSKVELQRHLNRVADVEECIQYLQEEEPPRSAAQAERAAAILCTSFTFFERLGALSRFSLAQKCRVVRVLAKQAIIKEGDFGKFFYVLLTGRCAVYKRKQKAVRNGDPTTKIIPFEEENLLGPRSYMFLADEVRSQRRFGGIVTPLLMGDTFGERALFNGGGAHGEGTRRRAASVVASVDSYLLEVGMDEFLTSIAEDQPTGTDCKEEPVESSEDRQEENDKTHRITAGARIYAEQRCRNILSRPSSERRPDDIQLLCEFVSGVSFFSAANAIARRKNCRCHDYARVRAWPCRLRRGSGGPGVLHYPHRFGPCSAQRWELAIRSRRW